MPTIALGLLGRIAFPALGVPMPRRKSLTPTDIAAVFAALRLETPERREAILAQGHPVAFAGAANTEAVVTFIGAGTEPLPERDGEIAGMERTS